MATLASDRSVDTWPLVPGNAAARIGERRGPARGLGGYIATGANGTILLGSVGAIWTTVAATGTTRDLRAAALGNSRYVVAGAAGTVVTSTDGVAWTVTPSGTTNDIRGLAYAGISTTTDGVDHGQPSLRRGRQGRDGPLQQRRPGLDHGRAFTAGDLNAVVYGGQFVAVGAAGGIFTSPDGLTWTARNSDTTADLTAITRTQTGYTAVGTAGTIISSF